MSRSRALLALPLALALLTGCASGGENELRDLVDQATAQANDRDADGLRRTADALIAEVQDQIRSSELGSTQGDALLDLAQRLKRNADLIEEAEPPPSPSA